MTDQDHRPKILIVDDNKENIDLLMEMFRDEYRVSAATRPERALKLARAESPPDIILLDILMPEMDGYQVCAALKGDEATRDTPVVFVTAVSEVMDAARGFAAGAVDYITKPFHPPVVKARVKLHLELKRKYELLESYAFLDALTEIANRRRFDQVLDDELNRAGRSQRPLSLIYLDVDHFKLFNDTYGHGAGDDCLRRLAKALSEALNRSGDFIARYGGEEFMILLPYTDAAQARQIAEQLNRVVDALAIEHPTAPSAPHVTVSMGIATVTPERATATSRAIVEAADRSLYAAKRSGRHRIETTEV
ncbi:diguanylate cyclase [Thiococcus pfennigii]|uniref:GGDEF domain-containing response regulator n=1 Tax=Thiococcus pfennigii TaxID=1057 RepID=UPI001906C0E6|nr:diguanylate cyclase [Thiococcus pfennigii]MBK1701275.1 diguanylate cyclase response regulator [Thiococcus pfennigii]